jgi:succinyl-diaminopimelate desuccinylase
VDLLALTAELVAIPSASGHERALADHLEELLRAREALEVVRIGDNLVARSPDALGLRLLLAGHLDTVPPAGGGPVLDGDVLYGCGSADMKSGIAVMVALAALEGASCDRTFVFYAREEVARAESGLLEIEAARPDLLQADAAVLLEPTAGRVEAGCQGVLRLGVTLAGRRAHSARPWTGVNAIHRVAPLLERVAAFEERRPVLDGCEYHETLQAVSIEGGVAGNVVPDACRVVLSHRFAPDRSGGEAEAALADLLAPALEPAFGDRVERLELAPAAPPHLDHPALAALVAASGTAPAAKLGWTDVAFFAERGVPAANFGPGDPLLAHREDERVGRAELEAVYEALAGLLGRSTARPC